MIWGMASTGAIEVAHHELCVPQFSGGRKPKGHRKFRWSETRRLSFAPLHYRG